jgi:hypothetical protein
MEKEDIILILEIIRDNPNIEVGDISILIEEKISWETLLKVFVYLGKEGLILRENNSGVITKLGVNKLIKFKKELEIDTQIQELTIKELKGNVFQLKFWWLIILINTIISFAISFLLK